LKKARTFATSGELREAMEWASVTERWDITVLEEIDQSSS
jgi:hypothetical protein